MTALVVAVQIVLPLALLLWLALLPAASLVGFAAQVAGTAAFLFSLGRVAQWAVPVWWLPHVYGGLWLAAVATVLMRRGLVGLPPLGVAGWYGTGAMAGRALPPGSPARRWAPRPPSPRRPRSTPTSPTSRRCMRSASFLGRRP